MALASKKDHVDLHSGEQEEHDVHVVPQVNVVQQRADDRDRRGPHQGDEFQLWWRVNRVT